MRDLDLWHVTLTHFRCMLGESVCSKIMNNAIKGRGNNLKKIIDPTGTN